MEVILILIVVSLLLAGGFLAVFLRASRQGQFEDTVTPALRMLADDPPAPGAAAVSDERSFPTGSRAQGTFPTASSASARS